jgi:hypothetical protein
MPVEASLHEKNMYDVVEGKETSTDKDNQRNSPGTMVWIASQESYSMIF